MLGPLHLITNEPILRQTLQTPYLFRDTGEDRSRSRQIKDDSGRRKKPGMGGGLAILPNLINYHQTLFSSPRDIGIITSSISAIQ